MAYFEWTSAMEIGHAEIDAQHRQLVLLGEAVVEPLLESAGHKSGLAQLQALIDFTQGHFAFEEGLMRCAGYPDAERHAKYHASLLTELRTYCAKTLWGESTYPGGLISFLWNWLVLHIDSADRELAVWLRSRDPDGRLPVINAPPVD